MIFSIMIKAHNDFVYLTQKSIKDLKDYGAKYLLFPIDFENDRIIILKEENLDLDNYKEKYNVVDLRNATNARFYLSDKCVNNKYTKFRLYIESKYLDYPGFKYVTAFELVIKAEDNIVKVLSVQPKIGNRKMKDAALTTEWS